MSSFYCSYAHGLLLFGQVKARIEKHGLASAMAQSTKSELKSTDQPEAALHLSTLARIARALIFRAASLLSERDTTNPVWLKAEETYSRRILNRYEIYTEDIGPVGLKNIQILLDRWKKRLPGSTLHVDLIGRDRGTAEASLKIDIVTKDEEAVLELAAEIRRSNGQSWMGVYVTTGTFIEIAGPKDPIIEICNDSTPDDVRNGGVSQKEHEVSDLEPPAVAVAR
jgi:hypothetical protein